MDIEKFEKRIKHLSQTQILSGAISSLNKLLVDKGVVTYTEIQKYFSAWMEEYKLTKKKTKKRQR